MINVNLAPNRIGPLISKGKKDGEEKKKQKKKKQEKTKKKEQEGSV